MKYTQKIIPVAHTPEAWKNNSIKNLRFLVFDYLRKLSGLPCKCRKVVSFTIMSK